MTSHKKGWTTFDALFMDRQGVEFRLLGDLGDLPVITVEARHPDFPDLVGRDVVPGDRFGQTLGGELEMEMMRERAFIHLRRQVQAHIHEQRRSPTMSSTWKLKLLLVSLVVILALAMFGCDAVFEVRVPYCPASEAAKQRADSIPLGCALDSLPHP